MGAIRTLYTDLVLRADKAVKGLKVYDRLWKQVAQSVETSATAIEKAADRSAAAMARISEGAALLRAGAGAGMGGASPRTSSPRGPSTRSTKPTKDPLDAAIKAANVGESRRAGLSAGTAAINDATAALGKHASKTEVAKAKIEDFTAQVERNRREVSELKRKTIEAGDADGTLAARMTGLSVATGRAQIELSKAKRELTALNGGLINTIKSTITAKASIHALGQAAGNALTGAVSGGYNAIKGSIVGATEKAIAFESSLVGISKVARGTDDTAEGFERIKAGIKATSKELGVLPTEVSNLTAQLAPAFSGVKEGASETAVDIVALANDVTKIGVAWDITGKEAGKSFAEISAGLQLTTDETKSLFGGINEVGNQLGVNAATLAEAVQRSAGVLKGASISGETGAALNAVLIKTGSSAEVAATGVRTFIARLGAGEAATKKQLHAFEALGLSAKDVAKELTSGDAMRAEEQIKKVVAAIGTLDSDQRLPVLIEMFGSESIGSIGAAATATDLLAQSMAIMGDKTAATTSVQKEFDRVSATSASKVNTLKANIEVLAIQFGERLLPYVNKLVEFLTSKEGQEWGAKAVEKAVTFVTGFADGLASIVGFIAPIIESLGGLGMAIGAVGIAAAGLTGPFGLAAAAGIAAGAAIMQSFMSAEIAMNAMMNKAADIRHKEHEEEMKSARAEMDADQAGQDSHTKNMARAEELAKKYEEAELAKLGPNASEADKLKAFRKSRKLASAVNGGGRELGGGTEEDRIAAFEKYVAEKSSGGGPGTGGGGDKQARFDEISSLVAAGHKLAPSVATEYTKLSKELDQAKASKAKRGHKQTKMDRQLAAIDPSVRGLLTQGGEEDRGGDSMVAKNALDKAVFGAATGGKPGRGGLDGLGGVGPGPNITNHYTTNNVTTTVTMPIDARSTGSVPANIASAAQSAGVSVAGVTFTGISKVLASKNAGGAMRPG